MEHTNKKQIVVGKLGDGLMFSVKDSSGEILYECTEPFRAWGINRCAEFIRTYNEEQEDYRKAIEDGLIKEPPSEES